MSSQAFCRVYRVLPRNSEWWPFFHKGGMYIMHIYIVLKSIDWSDEVSAG